MPDPAHITFIHGLANKPAPSELRRLWLEALATPVDGDEGFDPEAVGVTTSFVYWADLFYAEPISAADYESRSDELQASVPGDPELPDDEWVEKMRRQFPEAFEDAPPEAAADEYERVPLPGPLKKRLMRHVVREAHDYLFDKNGVRETIRQRVLDDLQGAEGRRVLVGHSQGSFIAYDILTGVPACPPMEGLLTLGSPLGVDEIQDRLMWNRANGFPAKLRGDWVNVYDPLDAVARADPRLANDFRRNGEKAVVDVEEENWGTWRHSATKYLKGRKLRSHLRRLCGRGM